MRGEKNSEEKLHWGTQDRALGAMYDHKTRHFYISHRPPLHSGVDTLSTSSWWSTLDRFSVGFRSFPIEIDQKLTKNRPKVDLLQGVRWGVLSLGGVKVCG